MMTLTVEDDGDGRLRKQKGEGAGRYGCFSI